MARLGCLVIHGWSAAPSHVSGVAPRLEELGVPHRVPCLRGHATHPQDLRRVGWREWYADAEAALDDLLQECEQAVLVGHSMGGLLALLLAANRPEAIAGVAAAATALRVANPLFPLSPYLAPLLRRHRRNILTGYSAPEYRARDATYPWVPASAVSELYRLTAAVEPRLAHVRAPLLLIHSVADRVVSAEAVEIIYRSVASAEKQVLWFQRSGHEMFLDCEADAVIDAVLNFILRLQQEQQQSVV